MKLSSFIFVGIPNAVHYENVMQPSCTVRGKTHANHSMLQFTYIFTAILIQSIFTFANGKYTKPSPRNSSSELTIIHRDGIQQQQKRAIHLHKYLIEMLWSKFTVKCMLVQHANILIRFNQKFVNIHSFVHFIEIFLLIWLYRIDNKIFSKCNQSILYQKRTNFLIEKQQKTIQKINFQFCLMYSHKLAKKNSIKSHWIFFSL